MSFYCTDFRDLLQWDYERRNDYLRYKISEFDYKAQLAQSGGEETAIPFPERGWNQLAKKLVIPKDDGYTVAT